MFLLARWPYASWNGILRLEPNTIAANVKKHKRATMALGGVFTVVICLAITYGIQNGHDRAITARIEEGTKDFQDLAVKIGKIKGREMRTTKDYVDGYGEIEPLLTDFDDRFGQFTAILTEAEQQEIGRGPFNVRSLFSRNDQHMMQWDFQMFDLLRQDIELTKKEVVVTKEMAALPPENQVEYWKKNFKPLAEEEDVLSGKIAEVMKKKPS